MQEAETEGVVIETDHPTLSVDEKAAREAVLRALHGEGAEPVSVGIVLTGHEAVLELNRAYLDHDYLTDVLSFNLSEDEDPLKIDGEVYVDLDTAAERHAEFGVPFEEEVLRYIVHGVLHLIGYTDDSPEEKAFMQELEDRYLQ